MTQLTLLRIPTIRIRKIAGGGFAQNQFGGGGNMSGGHQSSSSWGGANAMAQPNSSGGLPNSTTRFGSGFSGGNDWVLACGLKQDSCLL
eukprot:scaffold748_cov251-Pinguiococcus_pyrenoidosus.AAC.50